MDTEKFNVQELEKSELKETNGGIFGVIVGLIALSLAAAEAYGYYEGKKDCPPKPCIEK